MKNRPDPFDIYKPGERPRKVHAVDYAAWAALGWSDSPDGVSSVPDSDPVITLGDLRQPKTPERLGEPVTPPKPPSAYDLRKAELEAMLKQNHGWRKIAAIAEPLGIEKPEGGWDDAIALILEKEELSNG